MRNVFCLASILVLVSYQRVQAQSLIDSVLNDYTRQFGEYNNLPLFKGGSVAFANYLFKNIVYPPKAIGDTLEGQVLVQLTVSDAGDVSRVEVLKGIRKDVDDAVTQVFMNLPKMHPAFRNKQNSQSQLLFVVSFNLQQKFISTTKENYDVLAAVGITAGEEAPAPFLSASDERQLRFKNKAQLINHASSKIVKIREKTFARFSLRNDATAVDCIIVDILDSSMVVAVLQADTTVKQRAVEKLQKISYGDITRLEYLKGNSGKLILAVGVTILGMEMITFPIILPLIIQGGLYPLLHTPALWVIMALGVPTYIIGNKLTKRLKPDKYDLQSDWSIAPLKIGYTN